MGKQWNTPLGLQFRNVEIDFASPEREIINTIRNSLLLDPNIRLYTSHMKAVSVIKDDIKLPDHTSEINLETLGEVVIKKSERDGRTLHIGADDDVEGNLRNIIMRQFSAFSGGSPNIGVKILSVKQKKKAIVKDSGVSNSFLALRLRFQLRADPEVHEFILTQGIGHHRKMGFGMMGIMGDSKR